MTTAQASQTHPSQSVTGPTPQFTASPQHRQTRPEGPPEADARHAIRRHLADRALLRIDWLDDDEKTLVRQVIAHGVQPAAVARLTGVRTRTVQHRLQRIVHRLASDAAGIVIRGQGVWEPSVAHVALLVWVRGLTYQQVADRTGLSMHTVRQKVQVARGLIMADPRKRARPPQ